jgi:DNA invertase Pin-like site-specific DNA recombinase
MKPVACYARVSSDDQATESQRDVIEQWLDSNGIGEDRVRWYEDFAETGKTLHRGELNRLRDDVAAGRVKTVVVYKLDRLSRDMLDGLNLVAEICSKGCRVVSVTQQIDVTGTVGRMMAAMLFGFAEIELAYRAERQAAGIAVARRNGVYKGRAPGSTKKSPERARELKAIGLSAAEISTALGISIRTAFRYLNVSPTDKGSNDGR